MSEKADAAPADGAFDPQLFTEIVEGQASMLYDNKEKVFYNKVQVLNRDLSIQVISHFSRLRRQEWDAYAASRAPGSRYTAPEGIVILDALAATGLRSIRYLKEIPGVSKVVINDMLPDATAAATKNVVRNGVPLDRIEVITGDACHLMYNHREPGQNYDVVDLDPYGSAAPFLDAAVQAVADGGLLCVTCTDMPVLSGNYPETSFAKYGTFPVKAKYHHEVALRTLLNAIETSANRYKKHIVPWVSCAIDFYVRVFVRVFVSPNEVKKSCMKRAYVHQSKQCASYFMQPMVNPVSKERGVDPLNPNNNNLLFYAATIDAPAVCPETGSKMKIGGPFYAAPMHDKTVVEAILETIEPRKKGKVPDSVTDPYLRLPIPTVQRLHGLLTAVSEELLDVPFFYHLADLCSTVRCAPIPMAAFQSALVRGGYRVSQSHKEPMAIKTNAPDSVVWDIMRCWCKTHPPEGSIHRKEESNAFQTILAKEPTFIADFEVLSDLHKRTRALRHPPNPEVAWGPKRKATGKGDQPQPEAVSRRRRSRPAENDENGGGGDDDDDAAPVYFEWTRGDRDSSASASVPEPKYPVGSSVLYGNMCYAGIVEKFDGTRYLIRHNEKGSSYHGLCAMQTESQIFDPASGARGRRNKRGKSEATTDDS